MRADKSPIAIALTRRGALTAAKLAEGMGARLHLPARLAAQHPGSAAFYEPVREHLKLFWNQTKGFLLVMASGVAVRSIAPLLHSKYVDPAVVVFDPDGRYAVPILSGHLGGANRLAGMCAGILGGQAVITTATDAASAPAIEVWASENGFALENPKAVSRFNLALADGDPAALFIDRGLKEPENLGKISAHLTLITSDKGEFEEFGGVKTAITHRHPAPRGALILRPRVLALGVGARKNAPAERAAEGIVEAMNKAGFSEKSAAVVATVDIKKDEEAIRLLAERLQVPVILFEAAKLKNFEVPNPSERVLLATGSPTVCEAAALAASGAEKLLLEKTSGPDWTLALAMKKEFTA